MVLLVVLSKRGVTALTVVVYVNVTTGASILLCCFAVGKGSVSGAAENLGG